MTLSKTMLIGAALAALGGTTVRAAEAALSPDPAPLISEDDWIHKPTSIEAARFYPVRALRMMRIGEARLRCAVEETGEVTGCVVAGESLPGYGFGAAALKMSHVFLIRPRAVNGFIVTIPVEFKLH